MNKEIKIPEGYEARIDGNKVIFELKESEDELIRKRLINLIKELAAAKLPIATSGYFVDGQDKKYISYLEKQKDEAQKQFNLGVQAGREEVMYEMEKEQKPTEWNEQDERNLYNTIEAIKYSFDVSEGSGGLFLINWLKYRLRHWSYWKPSKEQMEALEIACNLTDDAREHIMLSSLYEQLKKL